MDMWSRVGNGAGIPSNPSGPRPEAGKIPQTRWGTGWGQGAISYSGRGRGRGKIPPHPRPRPRFPTGLNFSYLFSFPRPAVIMNFDNLIV